LTSRRRFGRRRAVCDLVPEPRMVPYSPSSLPTSHRTRRRDPRLGPLKPAAVLGVAPVVPDVLSSRSAAGRSERLPAGARAFRGPA